jgi:dihydroorotase
MNRGIEITPEVADGPQSCVLEQVTNGVAVRMAILYLLITGDPGDGTHPAAQAQTPVTHNRRATDRDPVSTNPVSGRMDSRMLLIKNGRVIDPASKTDAAMDVLLDGEVVKEVVAPGKYGGLDAEIFDAAEMIVAPGFIDLHVHLREPGQESSETIQTGTDSAARGGFTAVCCMPNTKPVHDNASITRFIVDKARRVGATHVWPIGAASVGSQGEGIAEIAAMKEAGIVAVSDDGKPIATARLTRQVMDYCRSLDLPIIEHSEDVSLAAGAVMREGVTSTRLGLRGMPGAAESVCVARDVQLAELTGARLHIAHLSAKGSLDQVRWAKSNGLHVTCEVTPHHFTLIDEDVQYDSRFKMNPPLLPGKIAKL